MYHIQQKSSFVGENEAQHVPRLGLDVSTMRNYISECCSPLQQQNIDHPVTLRYDELTSYLMKGKTCN